jgi:hypothetical protein
VNEKEKRTVVLRKQRDALYRGGHESNLHWIKPSFTDPFVYLIGLALFTSSVVITGFGVFLPTIIQGLWDVFVCITVLDQVLIQPSTNRRELTYDKVYIPSPR